MNKYSRRIIGVVCALALILAWSLPVFLPRSEEVIEPTSPTTEMTEAPTSEPTRSREEIEEELKQKEEEERRKNPILFSEDITFERGLIISDDYMPYVLYIPSCVDDYDEIPLIVWLHGAGDASLSLERIDTRGLPCALKDWQSEGFNAYIVCPQLYGNWYTGVWGSESVRNQVCDIVKYMLDNYNVNPNKVVISGHSLGAQGAMYIAATDPDDLYSAVVPVSGFRPNADLEILASIHARGYSGTPRYGDGTNIYNFTVGPLADVIGEENIYTLNSDHVQVAVDAFTLDENGDNKSDLIEWMLTVEKPESIIENTGTPVEEESGQDLILFSEDITFSYEWTPDSEHMPYALYTPSCADNYDEIPLIVWLHGSGEKGVSEGTFRTRGLPAVMENWSLEGFNAYVLCPQLYGSFNTGSWNNPTTMNYLKELIDIFISEYNVDPDKVFVSGHSLGGQGCLYMAHELPGYFTACVSLSPYYPNVDMTEVEIPTIAYVGTPEAGEDNTSYRYALQLQDILGEEAVTVMSTYHGGVPNMAFNLDKDENGCSDLIEWLFSIDRGKQ